jgi:hypothetical protein
MKKCFDETATADCYLLPQFLSPAIHFEGKLRMRLKQNLRLLISFSLVGAFTLSVLWIGLSNAQSDETGIVIVTTGEFRLAIERIWNTNKAGYERPDQDVFLIFEITLYNDKDVEAVFYGKDFPIHLDDKRYEPQNMKEVRDKFYAGRDYPGFTNGQPIAAHSSEQSLLVYDLPEDFAGVTLEFNPEGRQSQVTLQLMPGEEGGNYTFIPVLDSEITGYEVDVATFTPTPTPTATPVPTSTPRPSITPIPSATRTPTPVPQTRYVTTQTLNVRSCIGVNCSVVTTLAYGDSFEVTGQGADSNNATWYSFEDGGQTVWVAGWYTSTERPAAQVAPQQPAVKPPSAQPPAVQPPVQQPTQPPAPAYTCNCSKTCEQMSSCEEAYFQLNQCGCSRRDGDGDGVPCENICPGG